MKGTSGFREVRSSPYRSPTNRSLREHPHKFGIDSWHLLATEELKRMAPHGCMTTCLLLPSLKRIAF